MILFKKRKSDGEFTLDASTLSKIETINTNWNLEPEEALETIVDIAYLFHTMGVFPSCKSNSVNRINSELINGLAKLDYAELTTNQRENIKLLLSELIPYDNNVHSLSDKLFLTVPALTQLAAELSDMQASNNSSTTASSKPINISDLSAKERRTIKKAIVEKSKTTTNKTKLLKFAIDEFNITEDAFNFLIKQIEQDTHSREMKEQQLKSGKSYNELTRSERKEYKDTIRALLADGHAQPDAISKILNVTGDTAKKLLEQVKCEQTNPTVSSVSILPNYQINRATYEQLSKPERKKYKDVIRQLISANNASIDNISDIINVTKEAAEILLHQAQTELGNAPTPTKVKSYGEITKNERKKYKDSIKPMLEANRPLIEIVPTIANKFNIDRAAVDKLIEQAKHELKNPSIQLRTYEHISKNDRKEIKAELRELIKEAGGIAYLDKQLVSTMIGLQPGALQTILNQIVIEDNGAKINNQKDIAKQKEEALNKALNLYQGKIEKLLYDVGQISIADIAKRLNATEDIIRQCLTAMTPPNGVHPIQAATKSFKERKTAEILRLKREEIYSDEDIMKQLNLNQGQYNAFLESLYR